MLSPVHADLRHLPLPLTHISPFALLLGFRFLTPPVVPLLPYRHLPLLLPPPVSRLCAAIDATPVCRERARMREKWRRGVARTAETTSTTLAAAAPAALVAWPKSIDVPLSGPKRKNSSEKGRARSTRGARAPAVARSYRHLGPSEQPSRRPPTAPVVGLDWFCIAVQ